MAEHSVLVSSPNENEDTKWSRSELCVHIASTKSNISLRVDQSPKSVVFFFLFRRAHDVCMLLFISYCCWPPLTFPLPFAVSALAAHRLDVASNTSAYPLAANATADIHTDREPHNLAARVRRCFSNIYGAHLHINSFRNGRKRNDRCNCERLARSLSLSLDARTVRGAANAANAEWYPKPQPTAGRIAFAGPRANRAQQFQYKTRSAANRWRWSSEIRAAKADGEKKT